MIVVNIEVNVNGVSYGISREQPSIPGFNDHIEALNFFEQQVTIIRRAILANPTAANANKPVAESRTVDSGAINVKPVIRGH